MERIVYGLFGCYFVCLTLWLVGSMLVEHFRAARSQQTPSRKPLGRSEKL